MDYSPCHILYSLFGITTVLKQTHCFTVVQHVYLWPNFGKWIQITHLHFVIIHTTTWTALCASRYFLEFIAKILLLNVKKYLKYICVIWIPFQNLDTFKITWYYSLKLVAETSSKINKGPTVHIFLKYMNKITNA